MSRDSETVQKDGVWVKVVVSRVPEEVVDVDEV